MSDPELPANFRWLETGRIAGSALPESAESIDALYAEGVRAVVSFHPLPDAARARCRERGIEPLAYPISGFTTSLPGPLAALFAAIDRLAYPAEGPPRPVLFH